MKRLLACVIAVACCVFVQAKHLEFMGIPINGTITSFQTKLQAKGCTLSKDNNQLPTGIRGFKGVFAGKDCNIYVWYNHKTKQVYQVRVVTDCGNSIEVTHNTFYYYKNLLNKKYSGQALTSDMLEDSTNKEFDFDVMVLEPPIDVGSILLGSINVSIIDYDTFPASYGIAITYEDFDNSSKNEKTTLDDI